MQTFVRNKSKTSTILLIFIDNKLIHITTVEKKTYSYDEAYNASLEYFKGDELAARVWVNKYAVKDSFGNIYEKSPEDMHWRIANEVARVEAKYPNALSSQELFDLLDHFKYIVPQGSPMTCFIIKLLCNRTRRKCRLIRSYYPHRRRAGTTDEATWWCRT